MKRLFLAATLWGALVGVASGQTFNFTTGTQSWNVAGNWTPSGFPNAIGASATFNSPTGTHTVNLAAAITVGTINLTANGTNTFTLANGSGGSLTMDVASGAAAINFSGTSTTNNVHTISASLTLNDTLVATVNTLGTGPGTAAFIGSMGGSGGFTKAGAGRLSMTTATKAYTGATNINQGRLRYTAAGVSNGTSAVDVASGGMLMLDQNGGTFAFGSSGSALITLNGAGTTEATENEGALRKQNAGTTNLTNSVTLASASTIHVDNGNLQVNGSLSGSSLLTKTGGGTLQFNNTTNSFSGGITVRQSSVIFNTASTVDRGDVTLHQVAGQNTTFQVNANQVISNPRTLWTDTTGTRTQEININGSGVTLTIDQTTNTTFGNGAVGTLQGRIIGTGNLVMAASSTGILTLTGTNTYSGTTVINGGTLLINGSKTGSGTVTVNGGTLGGTGSITGATTISSGTVSPGNSAGEIQFQSALTFTAGTYQWELASLTTTGLGVNFDFIRVSAGTNTLGGSAVVNLNFIGSALDPDSGNSFWNTARQWIILQRTGGTLVGNFSGIVNPTWTSGNFSLSRDGDNIYLNFTPIPEPTTIALFLGGTGLAGAYAWRRRRLAKVNAELDQAEAGLTDEDLEEQGVQ